jgi:hypothetical protein
VHVCAALCHGRVKGNNRKSGNYQREAFHHSLLGTVLSCNVTTALNQDKHLGFFRHDNNCIQHYARVDGLSR